MPTVREAFDAMNDEIMKCERCDTSLNPLNVAIRSITEEEIVVECHNCIEIIIYKRNE